MEPKALTRDDIVAGTCVKLAFVEIEPSTGAGVYLRSLPITDYLSYLKAAKDEKQAELHPISDTLLLAKAICDKNGERLFRDDEFGIIASRFSVPTQVKLTKEVMRLLEVSEDQIEQLEKK